MPDSLVLTDTGTQHGRRLPGRGVLRGDQSSVSGTQASLCGRKVECCWPLWAQGEDSPRECRGVLRRAWPVQPVGAPAGYAVQWPQVSWLSRGGSGQASPPPQSLHPHPPESPDEFACIVPDELDCSGATF